MFPHCPVRSLCIHSAVRSFIDRGHSWFVLYCCCREDCHNLEVLFVQFRVHYCITVLQYCCRTVYPLPLCLAVHQPEQRLVSAGLSWVVQARSSHAICEASIHLRLLRHALALLFVRSSSLYSFFKLTYLHSQCSETNCFPETVICTGVPQWAFPP